MSHDFIPWDESTRLGDLPDLAAVRWPDRTALQYEGSKWTFKALLREINQTARGLMAAGVKPGDHIALWLTNCPEWVFLMFAIAKIGAVHVPINTRLRTDDARYIIGQADCSMLITHDRSGPIDYWEMVAELLPDEDRNAHGQVTSTDFPELKQVMIKRSDPSIPLPMGVSDLAVVCSQADQISDKELEERVAGVKPSDPLFIMYTSGTTGFPKGVVRHHGLLRNHVDRAKTMQLQADDVIFNYLPLFHIFGYVDGPLSSMLVGIRHILTPTFDADECLDAIEREGVSLLFGFEAHYKDLIEAQLVKPRDVSSLRTGICACGMKSAEVIGRQVLEILKPMKPLTAFGMTEIGANAALSYLDSSEEQFTETSGVPCDGFEFRVVNPETGQDTAFGEPGEIILKSYNMMTGYYKKPQETAKSYNEDGWFLTGDMGYLREDGYLRFMGRYKDMLKIGGENVDPMEVEGYLLKHPDVLNVAVIGYPDPRLTEVALAFIVRRDGSNATEAQIIEDCRGKIASFKIPRYVVFVDNLPMTSSGKIRKVDLRAQADALNIGGN